MGDGNASNNKGVPHYCEEFDKELNYKLWSTAGSRFRAGKRLEKKSYLSSLAINFCSGYVILFALFSLLFLNTLFPSMAVTTNSIVTFISITLSLFIIIFSQAESNSHYDLRASRHHSCGLEVAKLYKELRYIKSLHHDQEKDKSFYEKAYSISQRYDEVLSRYENHTEIDYLMFKRDKPDYEAHNLDKLHKFIIGFKYAQEFAMYWAVIILPIFLFIGLYFFVQVNSTGQVSPQKTASEITSKTRIIR